MMPCLYIQNDPWIMTNLIPRILRYGLKIGYNLEYIVILIVLVFVSLPTNAHVGSYLLTRASMRDTNHYCCLHRYPAAKAEIAWGDARDSWLI